MRTPEPHDLTAVLRRRNIRVQLASIDALNLECHTTHEQIVDVRQAHDPAAASRP